MDDLLIYQGENPALTSLCNHVGRGPGDEAKVVSGGTRTSRGNDAWVYYPAFKRIDVRRDSMPFAR
jgi:hypothetical protein